MDFPDAVCNDGSPTGIGINVGTSNNVLVYFAGGGAFLDAADDHALARAGKTVAEGTGLFIVLRDDVLRSLTTDPE